MSRGSRIVRIYRLAGAVVTIACLMFLAKSAQNASYAAESNEKPDVVVSEPTVPIIVTVPAEKLEAAQPQPVGRMRTVPEGELEPAEPPPAREPILDPVIQIEAELVLTRALIGSLSDPEVNVPGLTSRSNPPDTVHDGRKI